MKLGRGEAAPFFFLLLLPPPRLLQSGSRRPLPLAGAAAVGKSLSAPALLLGWGRRWRLPVSYSS